MSHIPSQLQTLEDQHTKLVTKSLPLPDRGVGKYKYLYEKSALLDVNIRNGSPLSMHSSGSTNSLNNAHDTEDTEDNKGESIARRRWRVLENPLFQKEV